MRGSVWRGAFFSSGCSDGHDNRCGGAVEEGHNLFQAGAFYSDFSNYIALLATRQLADTDAGPVPARSGVRRCRRAGKDVWHGARRHLARVLDGPNVLGTSRPWALELAPFGITVYVVAPGPVQTDMLRGVVPVGDPRVGQIAAGITVRHLGQPADVAHAVRFFCSEQAGFVTGQVLYV